MVYSVRWCGSSMKGLNTRIKVNINHEVEGKIGYEGEEEYGID